MMQNKDLLKIRLFNLQVFLLLCSVIFVVSAILITSLYLNDGNLIYSLDDPYISLRLAENLANGHYGLNQGEFASPASSILWPFLLVPFIRLPFAHIIPLCINIVACLLTAFLLYRTLAHVYRKNAALIAFGLLLFSNTIGLVFTGMEHSLEVLLSVAIVSAMIDLTEKRELPKWLMPVLIIAPLIRYELLSVSLGAIVLLLLHRNYKYIITLLFIFLTISAFSYFLWKNTGWPLPASVYQKLSITSAADSLMSVVVTVYLLVIMMFFLRKQRQGLLLLCYIISVEIAHLFLGKSGWFGRYEAYVILSSAFIFAYYLPSVNYFGLLKKPVDLLVAISFIAFAFYPYTFITISTPGATHCIYSQQVQMRRLLAYAGSPAVAVNDIGYVSFRNNSYVMDLMGLGSQEIQKMRLNDSKWMNIVSSHNIPLVMIYTYWFNKSWIPKNWVIMGDLKFMDFRGRGLIPLGGNDVRIYATNSKYAASLKPAILRWQGNLPNGALWKPYRNN